MEGERKREDSGGGDRIDSLRVLLPVLVLVLMLVLLILLVLLMLVVLTLLILLILLILLVLVLIRQGKHLRSVQGRVMSASHNRTGSSSPSCQGRNRILFPS
jgi:Flp pilus assembly protein TadB